MVESLRIVRLLCPLPADVRGPVRRDSACHSDGTRVLCTERVGAKSSLCDSPKATVTGPTASLSEEQMEAGFKARRWVVERAHSWMNRFRRLLIRWDKKPANYLAFLHFACGLIAFRAAGLFG